MLPAEATLDVGLFGAFVALLGRDEPLEQILHCPGALRQERAQHPTDLRARSEERRVGKECRSRLLEDYYMKKSRGFAIQRFSNSMRLDYSDGWCIVVDI